MSYPVTFTHFDEVMRTLAEYAVCLVLSSPSATYQVRSNDRAETVPGITLMSRRNGLEP